MGERAMRNENEGGGIQTGTLFYILLILVSEASCCFVARIVYVTFSRHILKMSLIF